MSQNKRNVDTDDLAKPSDGDSLPSGTGTHAQNRHEKQAEAKDNTAAGLAGRKAGEDKADPGPE